MDNMNSLMAADAAVYLAQQMANTRRENVYLIMSNGSGLTRAIPASEFDGISDHTRETLMRLVVPE